MSDLLIIGLGITFALGCAAAAWLIYMLVNAEKVKVKRTGPGEYQVSYDVDDLAKNPFEDWKESVGDVKEKLGLDFNDYHKQLFDKAQREEPRDVVYGGLADFEFRKKDQMVIDAQPNNVRRQLDGFSYEQFLSVIHMLRLKDAYARAGKKRSQTMLAKFQKQEELRAKS